jgi:membrane protein DedA with SNARE-associated domain
MAGGLLGYAAARLGGRPLVRRLATEAELARFQEFFDRWGGLAVIVSRALPVLPEVVSLMAGLARMRFGRFAAALAAGCVPTALLFAWLGHISRDAPWYGMVLAVGLPMAAWPVLLKFIAPK